MDTNPVAALLAVDRRVREEWVDLYHDSQGTPAYFDQRARFEELITALDDAINETARHRDTTDAH